MVCDDSNDDVDDDDDDDDDYSDDVDDNDDDDSDSDSDDVDDNDDDDVVDDTDVYSDKSKVNHISIASYVSFQNNIDMIAPHGFTFGPDTDKVSSSSCNCCQLSCPIIYCL